MATSRQDDETRAGEQVRDHLRRMHVDQARMAQILSILEATESKESNGHAAAEAPVAETVAAPAVKTVATKTVAPTRKPKADVARAVKRRLYIAEEQEMLRGAYQAFFESHEGTELVGVSEDTSSEGLVSAAAAYKPAVMLVGVKLLQPSTVEKLEAFREACPDTGLVLLSAFYEVKGLRALRELTRSGGAGCAYLLKHTIDSVDQLASVVQSVAEGRIILDPSVMEGLISSGEGTGGFLKELSPRELEVMTWVAKGYRNQTIAELLFLEPKTVERHINSIYSKLGNVPESMHPRVYACMLYLKAAGLTTSELTLPS